MTSAMPQSRNLPKEIEDAISKAISKAYSLGFYDAERVENTAKYKEELESARLALRTIIAAAIAAQRGG